MAALLISSLPTANYIAFTRKPNLIDKANSVNTITHLQIVLIVCVYTCDAGKMLGHYPPWLVHWLFPECVHKVLNCSLDGLIPQPPLVPVVSRPHLPSQFVLTPKIAFQVGPKKVTMFEIIYNDS